ncbi:MAG: hypothetical protein IKW20_06545 [Bacteroidales bacterium]|nr:hypothetical protein [Bacteroidales bacterium]
MDIQRIISASMEAGATAALIKAGLCNPLITQRQAEKVYGKWFTDAVKTSRLHPCRIGEGAKGTRWYSVNEINALLVADTARAEIIW